MFPEIYETEHLMRDSLLADFEFFWRNHYTWLKRPWLLAASPGTEKFLGDFEDAAMPSVPDQEVDLIVLPFLWRWNEWPFLTIGEAVEFFSQVFEKGRPKFFLGLVVPAQPQHLAWGLQNQQHHDGCVPNLERGPASLAAHDDPGLQPKPAPRSESHPAPGSMLEIYFIKGSDKWLLPKYMGFELMDELVSDMVQVDPTTRPTMDDVVRRFSKIKAGLSEWKLRSRFREDPRSKYTHTRIGVIRSTAFWVRQLYCMARRIPPIPAP
ncbi:hypothetical protein DFH09DRAFT_1090287 [Mycena vulgaris]|nr:hypothetical protein DFH09DRAFT_1090287 [Mycena vulgaris]